MAASEWAALCALSEPLNFGNPKDSAFRVFGPGIVTDPWCHQQGSALPRSLLLELHPKLLMPVQTPPPTLTLSVTSLLILHVATLLTVCITLDGW